MRKFALMLLLLLLAAPLAHAESLPLAARLDSQAAFERYQSYVLDEETGEWSAHGLIAEQLLGTVGQGSVSGYMGSGVCVLYPGVRGNRELSLMEPVLYVCLLRSSAIEADALSITSGGVRYDFVGGAEKTKIDNYPCERFALPLTEQGIALLESFAKTGGELRIYGEQRTFRTSIGESEKYKNSKLRVEAMSVAAVRDFLSLWPDDYALWDLSAAHWGEDGPEMAAVTLDEREYQENLPSLEAATQCLNTTKSAAVKAYQQLLKDRAFFTAKPTTTFGKVTRNATKQAQQYYGLLATGMPDRALIELLSGVAQSAAGAEPVTPVEPLAEGAQAEPRVAYFLEGQLSMRLDRAWEARSISPSRSADSLSRLWPSDRSNRLCAVDGEVINLSAQTMQLSQWLQASVRADGGASYPCTIQCERDEGHAFGASLLPQGKSRLVIVCEIPDGVDLASCALYLQIQGGGEEQPIQLGLRNPN